MDNGKQIMQYFEELANVLAELHVTARFHILVAGGAYMLLQNKRRSTEDIDFALIESPDEQTKLHEPFRTMVQRTEVSRRTSSVPFAADFKQAVAIVGQRHRLPPDWLNDEAAVYYYDDAPHAEVVFWRSFGETLWIYLPTMQYMLATKLAAYRPKDANDIQMLIQDLNVQTREQAQAIVDKFLLPDAQTFWELDEKLDILFP